MTTVTKVERIALGDLTEAQAELWAELRASNPALYSPYFHADYAKLVASLTPDAHVAILSQGQESVGFLPFAQRRKGGSARPIGAPMTDYHGLISAAGQSFDIEQILSDAKIGAFHMPFHVNMGIVKQQRQPNVRP